MNAPLDIGILVAIEGIDGAGKTTQTNLVAAELRQIGLDVVVSKEPTNGPHGQRLRDSAWKGRMSPSEELEEFILDRREHVAQLIRPAMAAGKVVILDRYYFSTAAYQGIRGLDWREIIRRNEEFAPVPDLLAIIQVPPALGVSRVSQRDGRANHFEREEDLLQSDAIFRQIESPNLCRFDGQLPPEALSEKIVKNVMRAVCDRIAARRDLAMPEKMQTVNDLCANWSGTTASRLVEAPAH